MEKIFAHYEAVIGDTVQIETDGGEKIPFKVNFMEDTIFLYHRIY